MSRRRRDSSDEEDVGHSARKRRRGSENIDIEERLESLITRVGEKSTSSLESNLEGLASVLEADLGNYKTKIMRILCSCVVKLPEKMAVYTTLIGLLNAKNYNCGGEFVEMLVRNLKEALKTGEYENAKLQVRFLADCVNCHVIVAGSLLALFDNFIEVTLEDNIPQVRSDWYVYVVLSALPWVARELHEKKETEFNKLLSTIDNYISKRQKIHVPALRVWVSDFPHPQEEYLDCLWAQIKNMKSNKWSEKQIMRPYLAFDGVLCEALQHTLPQIIPPSHNEESTYPLPKVIFRMFDYTDVPEGPVLPGSHSIERYLIEEQIDRIISTYYAERKDCAAALLSFPSKNKIPLNYMIVEVMFSQLFRLPVPPSLEIFYGSLLIELCKLQPGSMPQVLAQATEMLYERIDTMNVTCIERFANWFAYHLSNFQFRWSWDDWSTCCQMDPELPKPKFVKEVLLKCLRLSYHQRIAENVPESFEALIPEKPHPQFKYEKEGAGSMPGTMVAHQLMAAIKSKCTPEEAMVLLKDLPNPLSEEESDPTYHPLRIDVFVSVLLYLGSKSFSHSFAAIAKFHHILKLLADTEEGQIWLLRTMFEIWSSHQQMMVVLVDKLLKTQIVEPSAVANWLFSSEMQPEFTKFYVWEIMHATIKKMSKQVDKLQQDVEDSKDKLDAAKRKKRLFLIIFYRFIMILTDHLAKCEGNGIDYNTPWYKWVIERLQQIFLLHHELVFRYISTLESLLFTSDIDFHILEVFQQFCALRS
ncbi:nuclear cap-binding protein subunit 1-like [Saccostrea cucullata]|uniref:nuclear cap-binding protein subunit 1-like n=1 Tax=Saccostrea cuccullata TaxID=36930 RepID=UPI002ED5F809